MIYVINKRRQDGRLVRMHFEHKLILEPEEFRKIAFEVISECTEQNGEDELIDTFGIQSKMEERGFKALVNSMEMDISELMTKRELDAALESLEDIEVPL